MASLHFFVCDDSTHAFDSIPFSLHKGSYFCCEGINIQEISVLLQLLFKQKIES